MTLPDSSSHQQLHQVVSEQLRAAILSGQFKPGQWIRQKRIAEELGVSQMPVREALKELAAEGLIEHIPYRGMRVVEFTTEDVTDIYAHRACLECRAAGFTAQQITIEEIDNLKQIQVQLKANNTPENIIEYRRLNREFHQTIYRLSSRDYLIRILDQLWATFPTMLIGNFSQTSQMPIIARKVTDIDEHVLIIEALENHNPTATTLAVENHIASVCQDLLRMLTAEPNQ
jgi:DNA-binding GntR family transcriptional regulator